MTYEELLMDERWVARRGEIIKRDTSICTNCKNKSLIEDLSYSNKYNFSLTFLKPRIKASIQMDDNSFISGWVDRNFLELDEAFLKGSRPRIPHIIYKIREENEKEFIALGLFTVEIDTNNQIGKIVNEKKLIKFNWYNLKVLHVHHRYYREGWYPWEYPDDALTTLCWKCHETLHNNVTVKYLDKDGNEKSGLTPCSRCYGAGWFPEYKHIEAGVCFR